MMPDQPKLTDGPEIGAYTVAHVIKVAAGYATSRFYAPLLFGWAHARAGMMGITLVSIGQSVVWSAIGLALFLMLRPNIGTTPELVRRAGGQVTAGFEIGAYVVAQAIGIGLGYVAFSTVLPLLHPAFPAGGRMGLLTVVSLAMGAVVAAIEFVLFVHLRRRFAGAPTVP